MAPEIETGRESCAGRLLAGRQPMLVYDPADPYGRELVLRPNRPHRHSMSQDAPPESREIFKFMTTAIVVGSLGQYRRQRSIHLTRGAILRALIVQSVRGASDTIFTEKVSDSDGDHTVSTARIRPSFVLDG